MRTGDMRFSRSAVRLVVFVGMIAVIVRLVSTVAHAQAGSEAPRVTAIKQITRDAVDKSGLVAGDGELYVTEQSGPYRVIAKFSLGGEKSVVQGSVFADHDMKAADLSADQTRMLVVVSNGSGEGELWTAPVGAGPVQRFGELSGREGSWSADGKKLVFVKGSSLNVANGDGGQPRELYRANGSVFGARFSPDGARIRFAVSDLELGTTSLWEIGANGSNPHALLNDWAYKGNACCGSWTADGRYYIFQATVGVPNTASVVTTLWALAEGGDAPVQLTTGPMSFGNPVIARSDKNIYSIGVQPKVEVVKYLPGKKKFVPVVAGLSATDVTFTRDGKWMAYVSVPEGALWKARADGTQRVQLTSGAERAALPSWSPDGKQIAFVSLKAGAAWKLYLIAADGGAAREVVPEGGSQIDANWSSDGTRLMFGSFNHDAGGLNIRILDFKTGQMEKVPGSDGLFSPRWSPDEQHIAAMSPDGSALMRYDFDAQKWSKWIGSEGAVSYPTWSKDSQYLYFDDLVNGAETIRRVKVGETEAQPVFVLGTMERYLGPLGPWSGRAPDGSWMFVRDRSWQEVYELSLELP
jgi:Tol biopolymer transport system component